MRPRPVAHLSSCSIMRKQMGETDGYLLSTNILSLNQRLLTCSPTFPTIGDPVITS